MFTCYAAKLKGVFELHISKMDFINDCLIQESFCGGIYQITVSLNGKYTYDSIIQFVRNFGKRGGYPVQSTGAYYQNIIYISKLLVKGN